MKVPKIEIKRVDCVISVVCPDEVLAKAYEGMLKNGLKKKGALKE